MPRPSVACLGEPARRWLAARAVSGVSVVWKEDVRVWHPGQSWIWKAGGLGVFDPGINALSILTRILPDSIVLQDAELSYPENCETPIAARLQLTDARGTPIRMELDFRHTGPASWDIAVDTDGGRLLLSNGGSTLRINQRSEPAAPNAEYPRLYEHFAKLVRSRQELEYRPTSARRIESVPVFGCNLNIFGRAGPYKCFLRTIPGELFARERPGLGQRRGQRAGHDGAANHERRESLAECHCASPAVESCPPEVGT